MSKNLLPAETEYLCPNAKPKLKTSLFWGFPLELSNMLDSYVEWLAELGLNPTLESFVAWIRNYDITPSLERNISLSLETKRENVLDSLAEWLSEAGANYDVYAYLASKLSLNMGIGHKNVLASIIGLALETRRNNVFSRSIGLSLETRRNNVLNRSVGLSLNTRLNNVLNRSLSLSLETKRNNILGSSLSAQYVVAKLYYVNAFDNTYRNWNEVGLSPWLSIVSGVSYVSSIIGSNKTQGIWDFPNSGTENTKTLNNVYLDLYAIGVIDPDIGYAALHIFVYDGTSWTDKTFNVNFETWQWKTLDLSALINSWTKLDACRIYFKITTAETQYVAVDYMRLRALYTATEP